MKKIISKIHEIHSKIKDALASRGMDRVYIKKFLIVSVGVITAAVIFSRIPSLTYIVAIILFGILFTVLWFFAGYAVFRSLLVASVSLSFIIFIGQSYCSNEVVHTANDSVMAVIGFGFIYTIAQFFRNLYKELFGDTEAKEKWRQKGIIPTMKDINNGKHSKLALSLYVLLVGLFISQIYQAVNPIIKGLCIYR